MLLRSMKLHCGLELMSSKHELRLFGHHNRVKQQQVLELNQGIDKVVPQLKREIIYFKCLLYYTKLKKNLIRPRFKRFMHCPFTGPKMFCADPNFLSQPKNLTAYIASSKTFVPAQ